MYSKVLVFLALATVVSCNDVIVGLKTDGKKIFDENRQANPALWRQMDNVTIKAPENEVIRRVVITDLRPDKDGDVRVVEGGEGQKNVTIELKSPTVLRGYEFHIEVYSTPEEIIPFTNDQQSTTEIIQDNATTAVSTDSTTSSDTASQLPDLSTDKLIPAILSKDEVNNNEREGRNAKNEENVTSEGTTELTSTTMNADGTTTPTTQQTESVTENNSEKNSEVPNKFEHGTTISAIPLNKNFNIDPVLPVISGRDIANDRLNISSNDETRRVRDTDKDESNKSTEVKQNNTNVQLETKTENDKEAATAETRDQIPVEENSEDNVDIATAPKFHTFDNHKYTSVISSKVEHPASPIDGKDVTKLRNVRGANEEQKTDESFSTTTPSESTTTDIDYETTTLSNDCVPTEATDTLNSGNTGRDNAAKPDQIPIYLTDRQWNQRLNNPTLQTGNNQGTQGVKDYPAILTNDQTSVAPETEDTEHLGNDYKPSVDHLETRNPKISAIANRRDKNMAPVISNL